MTLGWLQRLLALAIVFVLRTAGAQALPEAALGLLEDDLGVAASKSLSGTPSRKVLSEIEWVPARPILGRMGDDSSLAIRVRTAAHEIDSVEASLRNDLGTVLGHPDLPVESDWRPEQRGLAVFSALPGTEQEIDKVFGDLSVRARNELSTADVDLSRAFGQRFYKGYSAEDFGNFLLSTDNPVVAVIGHNEMGNFHLLDSSFLRLENMAEACRAQGKLCIFLSCKSDAWISGTHLGVSRNLTPREAISIASRLDTFFSDTFHPHDEIQKEVERLLAREGFKAKLEIVVLATGGGIVVVYVVSG